VRLDEKQAQKRTQHWRAIAIAACEQSGRNCVPEVTLPHELHEVVRADGGNVTRLLLSPSGELRLDDLQRPTGGVLMLIGPEGGLTDTEQETALRAGFQPLRLGPRILRTETAAVAALTIIQREFGDLR
jgi:16S rRNA (uracil1498-N3)-methyltransferase